MSECNPLTRGAGDYEHPRYYEFEPRDDEYVYTMACCQTEIPWDEVSGNWMDCPYCGREDQRVDMELPEVDA